MTLPLESSPAHPDDLRLAAEALAGAPEARARIAERLACVHGILAARNAAFGRQLAKDELEDLAQDTLAVLWKKLPSFAGRASLETWCWRFCTLELMNALRKKSRRPRTWTDLELEPGERASPADLAQSPAGSPSGEHGSASDAGAELGATLKLLRHLSAREAQVIRLRHVDQLATMDEIAAALGISASSVKTHYYRGLEKLRTLLKTPPPNSTDSPR